MLEPKVGAQGRPREPLGRGYPLAGVKRVGRAKPPILHGLRRDEGAQVPPEEQPGAHQLEPLDEFELRPILRAASEGAAQLGAEVRLEANVQEAEEGEESVGAGLALGRLL